MTEQEKCAICLIISVGRETEILCNKAKRASLGGTLITEFAYGVATALIPSRIAEIPDKDAVHLFALAMGMDPRDAASKALETSVLPIVNECCGGSIKGQIDLIEDVKELETLRMYATDKTLPILAARIAEVTAKETR